MIKDQEAEDFKEARKFAQQTSKLTSGMLEESKKLIEYMGIPIVQATFEGEAQSAYLVEKKDAWGCASQDYDTLLYDPEINKRPEYIVNKVKESGAQGVVIMMMQFCDPEEIEFPSLKKGLDEAGIPYVKIGMDQQMTNFGQARTSLQAFSDMLSM